MAELTHQAASEILKAALDSWRPDVVAALQDAAAKRKISNTGQLINSIAATVINGDTQSFGKLLLYFEHYGRFPDIKVLDYSTTTGPPVEELVNWVKKRGVSNFKRIPGYKNKKNKLTEDQTAKRIAWGISFHRRSAQFKHKRKIWFNKPFMQSYNELQSSILKEYTSFVAGGISSILTDK